MKQRGEMWRLLIGAVGLISLAFGVLAPIFLGALWPPFLGEFLCGLGGGLIGAGAALFIIGRMNPAYSRELERRSRDERSRQIRGDAASVTVVIMAVLLVAATIVTLYFDQHTLANAFIGTMLVMVSILVLLRIYYQRRS
jgi:uncharacterized membrane protein